MILKKKRIGQIINFKRGYDLPSSERTYGEFPIISSSGVTDYHNEFKKSGEGIVTGRYGTLGEIFYVNGNYWPLNTTLYVTDFKGNNPKFIYYFLKTLRLERFNGASAVPGLDRNVIHKVEVLFLEDVLIQQKIASILSAYDELIENNKQRIKLLEEMAEEIYKEWFVRMRFQGYETSRFFNEEGKEVPHGSLGALPEEWEKVKAETIYDINIGKTPPREEFHWFTDSNSGQKWVSIRDINKASIFLSETSEGIISEGVSKFNMNIAQKDTVILSFKLTVGKLAILTEDMVTNEAIAHFNIPYGSDMNREYTYCYLANFQYAELGNTSSIGTAVNSKIIKRMPFIKPSKLILDDFKKILNPMFEEIKVLSEKNQLLQQTRDLLLPRLISGKLSVEHLVEKEAVLEG